MQKKKSKKQKGNEKRGSTVHAAKVKSNRGKNSD